MALLVLFLACSSTATSPVEAPTVGERAEVMKGTICAQLEQLTTGDSWKLPGRDLPSDDPTTKTRVLTLTTDWADRCTVNRLGDMDVGPSCVLEGTDPKKADAVWTRLEADFKACHHGWTLTDESAPPTREWVAERGAALHFLRLRVDDRGSWQLSAGAMPMQ